MYASILVALSLVLSPAPGVCRSAPAQPAAAGRVLLPPDPTPPPPPKQPERKKLDSVTAVMIDVGAAGDEGPVLDQRVRSKTEAELAALHILEGQAADIPKLVIKLTELGGEEIGWSYTIDINHEQVPIPGGSFRGECKDCTENELVDRVAGDVRSLLPRLRAYIVDYNAKIDAEKARNQQQQQTTPVEDKNKGVEPGPTVGPSDAGGFHPLCKVGIGMMAVGVIGVGAGVTMAVMPDRYGDACGSPDADPLACVEGKSTKLPGYVALGVGGALAIAGVALFVVGNRQSKQPRTALVPALGPGMLGLRWSARF